LSLIKDQDPFHEKNGLKTEASSSSSFDEGGGGGGGGEEEDENKNLLNVRKQEQMNGHNNHEDNDESSLSTSVNNNNNNNSDAPILTNTTLNVIRLFGKYIHMLSIFKIISNQVITYLMQLFQFYFYFIYLDFTQQDVMVFSCFSFVMSINQNSLKINHLKFLFFSKKN
jgi:hypothetical protein